MQTVPKVSVILPSYNHAKYLPQRIESIINQSIKNIEIIILDDCSPDDSKEIIERYVTQDSRIYALYNTENSGNTFAQWNKGLQYATGEYVWIAESDDYADLRFLEVLAGHLDTDNSVGLVYCDSWLPDENSVVSNSEVYLHWVDTNVWGHDFTYNGIDLIRKYMSFINIIPNASCALIRRSLLTQVGPAATTHKLVGDWLYWARLFSVTQVSYVAQKLNYYRQHANNVRSKEKGIRELKEVSYAISQMQVYGKYDTEIYKRSMNDFFQKWFNIFVSEKLSLYDNREIYINLSKSNNKFGILFSKNIIYLLTSNNFAGLGKIIKNKII